MHFRRSLSLPYRYKPWRPFHLRLVLGELLRQPSNTELDDSAHLEATIDWICRAQDVRENEADAGSISGGWSFEDGWLPGYPETSGYIVETLLAGAHVLGKPELLERARKIVDWELQLQNSDGSFPGHFGEPGSRPVIFNTGQIIHGLVAGYRGFGRDECLEAAVHAGNWMVSQQDEDGCWRRSVHNGVPHTYNTRAAWALLRVGTLAGRRDLRSAALRNLEWSLSQQTNSGWFRANAFTANAAPFTHTIAYALRGFLESGFLLEDERFVAAAERAARALSERQAENGWLAGTYGDDWVPLGRYCCLTGLAQMCIVWMRLDKERPSDLLREAALRGIAYLKATQRITGTGGAEDGGVAGSYPIWGGYSRFEYPNWAAKFFADALMMQLHGMTIPPADQAH